MKKKVSLCFIEERQGAPYSNKLSRGALAAMPNQIAFPTMLSVFTFFSSLLCYLALHSPLSHPPPNTSGNSSIQHEYVVSVKLLIYSLASPESSSSSPSPSTSSSFSVLKGLLGAQDSPAQTGPKQESNSFTSTCLPLQGKERSQVCNYYLISFQEEGME